MQFSQGHTFLQAFHVIVFPSVQRQKIKYEGEQILTNSAAYPPSSLSFHALCKHMHFPLSAHNYFLNFFTYSQTGHLPSIPNKRQCTIFFFEICFFKPSVTNIPDHNDGVEWRTAIISTSW